MINSVDKIFTSQERTVIIMLSSLLILGLAVNTVKDHYYYTGTENLTLIGTNDKALDFYAQMNEKDIDLTGLLDINCAEIEELTTLLGIGVKTAEKILISGMIRWMILC